MTTTNQINQTGAARAKQSLQIVQDADIAFSGNTYYAEGTHLVQSGKASVRKSQLKFEQMPSLADAPAVAQKLYDQQQRRDLPVRLDRPTTLMLDSGRLNVLPEQSERGEELAMSQSALGQLAQRANPSVKWAGPYLASCDPVLRAHNVNTHLATYRAAQTQAQLVLAEEGRVGDYTPPAPLTLRTMVERLPQKDGTTLEQRSIYGVVTERYAVYDLPQGVQDVLQAMQQVELANKVTLADQARFSLVLNGPRWSITVYVHNTVNVDDYVVGDMLRGWVRVRGVDDGTGSISVETGFQRTVCVNNTTIRSKKVADGIRHTGSDLVGKLVRELRASAKVLGQLSALWQEASLHRCIDQLAKGVDARYCFEQLVRLRHIALPGYKAADLVDRLMAGWNQELALHGDDGQAGPAGAFTAVAFSNAVTWATQMSEWKCVEDAEELEEQAGRLLYAHVVIPTPAQVAAEEARAAKWAGAGLEF